MISFLIQLYASRNNQFLYIITFLNPNFVKRAIRVSNLKKSFHHSRLDQKALYILLFYKTTPLPPLPRCHPKPTIMCAGTLASVVLCTKNTFLDLATTCEEFEESKDKEVAEAKGGRHNSHPLRNMVRSGNKERDSRTLV